MRLAALILTLFSCLPALAEDPVQLYRALRDNALDSTRVFRVRDARLDIEDLHITLNDGVIALLQPVDGHTTGAFFAGDGEVLVLPPTQVERESLALHTGAAVLEERFTTAAFRFSDDFSPDLMAATRGPADDPQSFLEKWDPAARTLSEVDALQLLAVLSRASPPGARRQRVFHARVAGTRLAAFDLRLDTAYDEQVVLGQPNLLEGALYYDIWTQFPMRSARAGRSAAWTFGEPTSELGPHTIAIRRYRITARIVPPHQLQADTTFDAEMLEGGDRTLIFQLSRYLQVTSVELLGAAGGAIPLVFIQNEALQGGELARRGNDLVAVVFPQPLQAGQKLQLRFQYAGDVLSEAGGGLMYVGARGIWYPNNGPAMADYDMEFRYPAAWTLVATGKKAASETNAGECRSRWLSERPIPMAGFNLGEYVATTAQAGDVLVESYSAPLSQPTVPVVKVMPGSPPSEGKPGGQTVIVEPRPHPAGHAPLISRDAAASVDFFSRQLAPYPYSTLALTQMPGRISYGWPQLIFLSSFVYLSPEERRAFSLGAVDEVFYGRLMAAHEVAHEWWGDAVLPRGYRNDWLMEALANYSALMMIEAESPGDFRAMLDSYRERLLGKASTGRPVRETGPVTLGPRLISSRAPGAYDTILYGRGTWLLHMLRFMLRDAECAPPAACAQSDQLFLRTLRGLYERHLGREITTADVQKAFEEALPRSAWFDGHRSLDWFFDGWVNGTAIPRYELKSVRINLRAGKLVATGKLVQEDAPERLVASIPIYARLAPRKPAASAESEEDLVYVGRIFADGRESPFRLAVPARTKSLVLDPYHTVLRQP